MSGLSVASGAAGGSPQIEGGMEGGWKALGQSARLGALIPHVDSVQGVAGIRMEGSTIASGTADRGGQGGGGQISCNGGVPVNAYRCCLDPVGKARKMPRRQQRPHYPSTTANLLNPFELVFLPEVLMLHATPA